MQLEIGDIVQVDAIGNEHHGRIAAVWSCSENIVDVRMLTSDKDVTFNVRDLVLLETGGERFAVGDKVVYNGTITVKHVYKDGGVNLSLDGMIGGTSTVYVSRSDLDKFVKA